MGDRGVEQRFVIRPGRSWGDEIAAIGPGGDDEQRFLRGPSSAAASPDMVRRMAARCGPRLDAARRSPAARAGGPMRVVRLGDYPTQLGPFARADVLVGNTPDITQSCREIGWTGRAGTISNFVRPVVPRPVPRRARRRPKARS